jgi:hypothetical protein
MARLLNTPQIAQLAELQMFFLDRGDEALALAETL